MLLCNEENNCGDVPTHEKSLTTITDSNLTILSCSLPNDEEKISDHQILAILTLVLFLRLGCYMLFLSHLIEQEKEFIEKLKFYSNEILIGFIIAFLFDLIILLAILTY